MKMRKLLASGVAASVAVTSMATVASAAEKTWDMGTSQATFTSNIDITGDIKPELGASADQAVMQWVHVRIGGKVDVLKDKNGMYAIVHYNNDGTSAGYTDYQNDQKWDAASAKSVLEKDENGNTILLSIGNGWFADATLNIKGYKNDEDGKKVAVSKSYTMNSGYNYEDNYSGIGTLNIAVLSDEEPVARKGEFAPYVFDIIESVELKATGVPTSKISNKEAYLGIKAVVDAGNYKLNVEDAIVTTNKNFQNYGSTAVLDVVDTYKKGTDATDAKAALDRAKKAGNNAAGLIAYSITNGGYKASTGEWLEGGKGSSSTSLAIVYPFIGEKWTDVNGARVVMRTDVQMLSYTGDNVSGGATGNDANQSYKDEDTTNGTDPKDFAGLASQFAEFFNKQTNGTVTFKFTTPAAAGSSNDWVTGGVPSTETGIKNALNGASANDFALFINYRSTGSLQALTSIDAAAGSVTFDVSDILDAMGGQTIGVVNDVYFGLATGVNYGDVDNDGDEDKGLFVESITFAYDEDSAEDIVEEEEEEAEEEEAEEEEVEEEEEEAEEEEEEEEAELEEEEEAEEEEAEEDDDDDVQGDVVTTPSEDDDSNPATGVALAVVPALVAAAAAVVSKKRK